MKLSGGQRQRVAIARVMLKDAPILLLDEATSALDSEVEVAIQQSLYRLMEGKTVVAIAHRLSTIAAMDRLIVMDHGRIVEEGDHRSLLAHGGIYARLWAHQSGGFLGDETEETAESRRWAAIGRHAEATISVAEILIVLADDRAVNRLLIELARIAARWRHHFPDIQSRRRVRPFSWRRSRLTATWASSTCVTARPFVLEAVQPVKLTSLDSWI